MVRDGINVMVGSTLGTAPVSGPRTLTELLRGQAGDRSESLVFRYSADGSAEGGDELTFGALDERARALAAWMLARGLGGARVLLVFPPGLEFVSAFFGCLYAGAVAVPASVPRPNRPMDRLRSVVEHARPAALLTTAGLLPTVEKWRAQVPALADAPWLAVEAVPDSRARDWRDPEARPGDLAFLQYTSGSTSTPKGVMVTHENLLQNSALIQQSFRATRESRGVFWLPLFHDMGLIGGVVQTLYCGGFSTLMSPVSFLQRPVRWLEAVSRTGATISGGPNFAFDLCARKVTEEQKAGLDLSRWSVAFNGAEPIRAETLDRFAEAFASCGFRREALLPCYGLAESTLLVTGKRAEDAPRTFTARAADLDLDRAVAADPGAPGTRTLVGSGPAFEGLRVEVVDPVSSIPLGDGRIGEIWVSGPSVTAGYWEQPGATAETFQAQRSDGQGPFLRTGDLGFVADGELYVTGRRKDLLIVRGRNVYPQDVEWASHAAHPLARAEGAAAFSIEIEGEERLVVVQEVERPGKAFRPAEVIDAVRAAVAGQLDLDVYAVCLLKPASLPKTSSGKVQRRACREAFLGGTLDELARSIAGEPAGGPPTSSSIEEPLSRPASEVEAWLVARLAAMLGVAAESIDARRPFASFGLGSLQAVSLAGELEQWLGRPLSPTLVYEYPTVEALALFLTGAPEPARVEVERPAAIDEPIAVVGIGCRFPGADGPESFWSLLVDGIDAVGSPPAFRRGPGAAGADRAGFLDRVDLFDAAFFGISPREAVCADPQQRLLLEVAWEALEDAGIAADQWRGREVGVFVGISTNDYGRRVAAAGPMEAYALTGNAPGMAANRISYAFDFRGPSLAIDSACSSSLVALHLACEALRRGEASLALACGVNLVLDRQVTDTFAASGFLAADGRCKTFDASADGYVRGEGAGVVVLKPLARALADGDLIHAVVRGSAVNQDGRSNGLTAPNREAQESVLRAAYRRAGIAPSEVDYVEAHGTGTLLGDPIEAAALAAVVGENRAADRPCLVGSVKSNIGHLEAAAGIAGVIKLALALERGVVPPSLHFASPNPHIPFDRLPIHVPTSAVSWPVSKRPRLAGVSAFGFGGTNAHAVLEAAPKQEAKKAGVESPRSFLIPISAQTPDALRALARWYRDRLVGDDAPSIADLAHTSAVRRSHHEHRLVLRARTVAEAVEPLDAFSRGEAAAGLSVGRRPPNRRPRCVFIYSGQGAQWLGMGRGLVEAEPVFREALRECDRVLSPLLGWSAVEELEAAAGTSRLDQTGHAQPMIFALQVALTALWRSWGVEPDAVAGHSLGEIAAAHASGALALDDAARVVALRARLMQTTVGRGLALAVALPADEAARFAADDPQRLSLACDNGPHASVLSGDPEAIRALASRLRDLGVFSKVLGGGCAFHSPQMDPLREELRAGLVGIAPRAARVPIVSSITGQTIDGRELGPEYWVRNLRDTVRFSAAATSLIESQADAFLEIGPHPALQSALLDLLMKGGVTSAVLPTLRRGSDGRDDLLDSLGALYAQGFPVAWNAVQTTGRTCRLPRYPFQRERFWLESASATVDASSVSPRRNGQNGHVHPNGHRPSYAAASHRNGTNGLAPAGWFEVDWRARERIGREAIDDDAGTWLLVRDSLGAADVLRSRLEAAGARCLVVSRAEAIDGGFAAESCAGVVHLAALDAAATDRMTSADLDAARSPAVEGVLRFARAVRDRGGKKRPKLWIVTAGAQQVGTHSLALGQATAWGLGRSLALEAPDAWGGLVDLDPDDPLGSVAMLADELLGSDGEDQVAYRRGVRYVARLVSRQRIEDLPGTLPVRPEGTYLITGGLGDLGLLLARRLVEQGARRIVLVGRRGLPDRSSWPSLSADHPQAGAVAAVAALETLGATVHVAAADVSDLPAMTALFAELRRLFPPLRGVYHAAGAVDDQNVDSSEAVFSSKVAGTWVLHRLTLDLPLDAFVAFSSAASVLGAKEADYAAANGFLDAFSHHRRSLGLPALSVNWGPWEGSGMAARAGRSRAHAALGLNLLKADDALDALAMLVASGVPQAAVLDADWAVLRDLFGANGRRFLDELPASRRPHDCRTSATKARTRAALLDDLRGRLADVLKTEPERVETDRPIDALGLDSLMAIELKNTIEAGLGATLPLASLLRGPTLDQLAERLFDSLNGAAVPLSSAALVGSNVASGEDGALSIGQRALWALHQLDPTSAAYNVAGAVRVAAPVDAEILRRSAQTLTDRHPALRTVFPTVAGAPTQRVLPRAEVAFVAEDASGFAPEELRRRIDAEANRPFDLERGPLFRVHLYRVSEAENALLLAVHHAVSDFWSVAVLLDELGRIYPALLAGRKADLSPPPPPFAEFVRRERELIAGPEGERHWTYWRDRLAGAPPALNLPTDRPRPAVQTARGAAALRRLDPALTARLEALGRRQGASLYITLLAAFQVLMARLSGQDNVVVGSPIAGRDRAGAAGVVGYFVNTLPLRARIDPMEGFETLLTRVRADVLDDMEHQEFPFGLIAERLQTSRDPSRSPLFQVLFAVQKAQRLGDLGLTRFSLRGAGSRMVLGGLPMESIALETRGAQFDLAVNVADDDGRLIVAAEYNADLFDRESVERILGRFEALLDAVAAAPTAPVGDLPVTIEADRRDLAAWNATDDDLPTSETFVTLFESQAAQTPNAVAVFDADGSLTYGELNARANRLARKLRKVGVRPDDRVAILCGRSCATLVGVLGTLKAGGAYVPLDPEYPPSRLEFLLQDSRAAVLLSRRADVEKAAPSPTAVIDLDAAGDGGEDDSNLEPAAGPDDLAYVIYTSGSTGTPKGVLVTHRNLAASTRARFLYYKELVERFLLVSSFAFDSSVAGLFWTLGSGGALVLPASGEATDPILLASLIRRHGVTHLLGVPSLYTLILEHAAGGDLDSLRTSIVAGESCPPGLPERHEAAAPQARLYNEYGPTEATVWATVHLCSPADGDRASVPIGRPIANTRTYVLDSRMNEVPVGVTGELYLGGVGVARGYLGRPGLTAERFVADPFSVVPGGRLYRTGDLARWRADGLLECLGRIDGQVKVRGHRIELGEVESALAAHPSVLEAAAAARPGSDGENRLVAYLVARPGAELSSSEVRSWLKARVPDALVPSSCVVLDDLPRSPNGKLDRAALPEPALARPGSDAEFEPPRNPSEAALAGLAVELLKIARVGVHDDLFELGFDSILAIQLAARARRAGLDVSPAQVFQMPTVAGLAALAGRAPPAPPEGSEARGDAYPLTPLQEGMLLHSRYFPGSGAYVQQLDATLRGALDLPALQRAWGDLSERHAVLRTGFRWTDVGPPLQFVERDATAPWTVEDWRGLSSAEQGRRLDAYLRDDRARGFDPAAAPLSRVALFRAAEDSSRLVWTYHHLLVDGWCLQIILNDLIALYERATTGREFTSPPPTPFRSYVEWLSAQDPSRAEPFWRRWLKGFREPTPLGLDRASGRSDVSTDGYDEQESRLSRETTAALVALGRRHGLTLGTIIQGAWAVLLSRYAGNADVVFGATVSGRSAPVEGIEGVVGPLINTLPVRTRVVGREAVATWLSRLQEGLVEAREYEATPLALVRSWSEVPRDRPLFESLIVFENYPVEEALAERAGGLGFGPVRVHERTEYPLTVTAFPGPSLALRITYDARRFDAEAIERMHGHLSCILDGIAADPRRRVDSLPLASADEARRIVDDWNDVTADSPDLDRLSDEEVEALIGDYLEAEEATDE